MTLRSAVFVAVLVLTPGCSRDSDRFVGTHSGSGELSYSFFGADMTQPRSDTVRVSEGRSTDLVLLTSGGCLLPANVDGDVATLVPNTSCTDSMTLVDGTSAAASFVVTGGTLRRSGATLLLAYEGVARLTYATLPLTSAFKVSLTLSPAGRAGLARPLAPQGD